MGVELFRGRTFTAEEERPGSGVQVAIVSYSFWRKHGSDPRDAGADAACQRAAVHGGWNRTRRVYRDHRSDGPELYLPLGVYESMMNDFEGHARPLAARDNPALMLVGRLRHGSDAGGGGCAACYCGFADAKRLPGGE